MKIYVICKDKSVLLDNTVDIDVYDHIETDFNKAKNYLKEHEEDFYEYKIIEEEITV